jgi:hypothetical protein
MGWTRKSSGSGARTYQGLHRFEHWYRDNQVYFLTARCRGRFPAFETQQAKVIFWRQFDSATGQFGFVPWVTTLLDNHYHTIGYLRRGDDLAPMMHKFHGSVAKLVNDLLEPRFKARGLKPPCLDERGRLVPFWRDTKNKNYFDGCLRDEKQGRLTYRYVLTQCRRHGICKDWRNYPHARVNVELDRAIRRALELHAFLQGVPYKRYARGTGA